jgi:hypothetical protein
VGEATPEQVSDLAAKWGELQRLVEAARGPDDDPWLDREIGLETAILSGPIRSQDDAIAKLRAIAFALAGGGRTDNADLDALAQTIRWLEAHRGPAA